MKASCEHRKGERWRIPKRKKGVTEWYGGMKDRSDGQEDINHSRTLSGQVGVRRIMKS